MTVNSNLLRIRDIMKPTEGTSGISGERGVRSSMLLPDALPLLLDAPGRRLSVIDDEICVGTVDESAMLEGLSRMISPRDDSSLVSIDCDPADYSASRIATAVEDADAHLVDLWTVPSDHDTIIATLRVRHQDPSACVHQLERYGFRVLDADGPAYSDSVVAMERLQQLQLLLSV